MKERTINILHFLLAAAIAVAFGVWSAHHFRYEAPPDPEVIVQHDTLIVRDTLVQYKPVPFNVYVVDTMWYEVPVYGGTDTVYVPLPREVKEYRDSSYRAKVTGYNPVLEEIEIYQKTKVVTIHETATRYKMDRITFGINAGYGLSGAGLSPYLGIGVSYNLFSLDLNKK